MPVKGEITDLYCYSTTRRKLLVFILLLEYLYFPLAFVQIRGNDRNMNNQDSYIPGDGITNSCHSSFRVGSLLNRPSQRR